MDYIGTQKVKAITGEALASPVTLRPEIGYEWLVSIAAGTHDDNAAARLCKFRLTDVDFGNYYETPSYSITYDNEITLTTAGMPFLVLRHDFYLSLYVAALAAGKKATLKIVCLERPESFDLWWLEQLAKQYKIEIPIISRL